MKTIIISLLAAMVMSACTKNNNIGANKAAVTNKALDMSANVQPANPNNPYDSVGVWHNKIISAVLNGNRDTSLQKIIGQVADFMYVNLGMKPDLSLYEATKSAIQAAPDNYFNLINDSNLSEPAKTYLHDLVTFMKDTANYTTAAATYVNLNTQIVALESKVITDKQLTDNDRKSVLEVTSIGRYSLYYWFNTPQPEYSLKGIIRIIAAVMGDIGGGLEGYYIGDIIGCASAASSYWYWNITYGMPG
jgi:hypothetical protein